MADESLNFKFSLDLSDFDKAPDKIASALASIKSDAEKEGKNVDLAMSGFLQSLIKEREEAIAKLSQELEKATKEVAVAFANMEAGVAGADKEYDKAWENMNKISKSVEQARGELQLLNEAEDEVAGNASFLNQLKMKAQGMDLYGKAMSMLPAPIANVIQSTKGLNKALLALTTNPIVMMLAGLVFAIKELYGWFDGLADRSDGVAYAFGVVSGAVDKAISAFNELIHLNVEGFLYNIKTMFDGGEREVAKRNEDLRRVEEQGLRDRLQRDNQFLRRRMNNTKLDMKDRLDAEKQYTENLKKIEETRRAELDRKMTEWSKKNGLRTKDNPNGWATDISQLSGPLQVELQEMYNEMARIDNAMADITEESKDRLVKMNDQIHSEFEANMKWLEEQVKARKQYQRQVREQLQAEKERLQALSTQTENMVIQSQIKDMADGIDKVTKEAELKAKQAFESLEKMVRDEAKNLYNNERSIFEGNPANEGKMFKSFKLEDYARQARKNIGYTQRSDIINNEQTQAYIKAVNKIADEAVKGARKVAVEVQNSIDRIEELSGQDLFGSDELNAGFSDFVRNMERFSTLQEDATQNSEELMRLERERLTIEMQIQRETDPDKKKELSDKLRANQDAMNSALGKSVKLEKDLQTVTQNVQTSFEKIRNTVSVMVDAVSQVAEAFKGISEEGDAIIDAMSQTLDFVGKLASGDYLGAVLQVVTTMARGIADMFRETDEQKEAKQRHKEYIDNMANIYAGVTDAVISYKQAMIEAKYAEQDLFAPTNVEKMTKAYEQMSEASEAYNKRLIAVRDQQANQITALGWYNSVLRDIEKGRETYGKETLMRQLIESGAVRDKYSSIEATFTAKNWYNSLVTGYQDYNNRGELFSAVLAKQGMKQLFDDDGEFDLTAFDELKKKGTDAWNGLDDAVKRQLESLAELKRKQDEYTQSLAESMATYYAPLVDNMTDAWMNWLDTGEDVMDSFRDYSANTFREIVKDQLKQNVYEQVFQPYIKKLSADTAKYLENGNMDENYAKTLASDASEMMEEMKKKNEQFQKFLEVYDKELEGIGIDINGSESGAGRSAEARGIARASQESVDENNARLAMMQQHTYSINANVAQLVSYSASALEHLAGIHQNTNQLARLERIEGILSDINTYGVRTR